MQDEKLRIALEALLALKDHPVSNADHARLMCEIAIKAIQQVQRDHYLVEHSSTVAEVIGAKKL